MKLFSFKGRAGRLEYFLHNTIDDVIMIVLIAVIIAAMAVFEGNTAAGIIGIVGLVLIFAVLILGVFSDAAVTVRRLHDLGKPGSEFWYLLIPIYNIILGFILLFKKGFEMENEYGPNPLVKIPNETTTPIDEGRPDNQKVRKIDDQQRSFPKD